jgi:putative RNA 2'-phosphotransferase
MTQSLVKTSKFLSLVLRHDPAKIGITLDSAGWVSVDELLSACATHSVKLDRALLETVVRQNDKQRFSFSADGTRIRANQGHSVEIELGYAPATPPELLYHGTATRFLASIRQQGLRKGARHHVHLSADVETATRVGQRHGQPVVLTIHAAAMHQAGYAFYLSANGVWLTAHVPVAYLVLSIGKS